MYEARAKTSSYLFPGAIPPRGAELLGIGKVFRVVVYVAVELTTE
jgi:hypothetical protein